MVEKGNINRDDVRKYVEVFYPRPFKTFYVNSLDGQEFVNPFGVFVSLGITTSLKTLNNIKDIIDNSRDFNGRLVEIASRKIGDQYLNFINNESPNQMQIPTVPQGATYLKDPKEFILNEKNAKIELEKMKDLMHPDQDVKILQEYAPRIGQLGNLIHQIEETEGDWNNYWILRSPDNTYKLFHRYINYADCGDVEYRVGIFVTSKPSQTL